MPIDPRPAHPSVPQVKHMALHIGAADGQPDHAFPHLAGSHLTEQQLVSAESRRGG